MNYKEKVYRVETTQKLMQSDDNIEPPHLVQMFYELLNKTLQKKVMVIVHRIVSIPSTNTE